MLQLSFKFRWPIIAAVWAILVLVRNGMAEDHKTQSLTIGKDERVLHLVAPPFQHTYCLPRLESLLLQHYGASGLSYRQVECGTIHEGLSHVETWLKLYRPTIAIIQTGNSDLLSQYRSPKFDFSRYETELDGLVTALRERNVQVVICSPIPIGNESVSGKLLPPNDGVKTWVEQGRTVAARRGAAFVDLFSAALDWPMIGNKPGFQTHYALAEHERSFELLRTQLQLPVLSKDVLASGPLSTELTRGHQLVRELEAIRTYHLPAWIEQPDFADQQRAAMDRKLAPLSNHDQTVRRLVTESLPGP